MLESRGFQVSVKHAKTGAKIPVVNDVHLHSVYDPEKEAKKFIESHIELINKKSHILVFGLGFGYHLHELYLHMVKKYNQDFQIYVIEPIEDVYEAYKKETHIKLENTIILSGQTAPALYRDKKFINFLMMQPGVLPHPPSFNLHVKYFKTVLGYKASKALKDIAFNSNYSELKVYLENHRETDLDELVNNFKSVKQMTTKYDFLLKAHDVIDNIKSGAL